MWHPRGCCCFGGARSRRKRIQGGQEENLAQRLSFWRFLGKAGYSYFFKGVDGLRRICEEKGGRGKTKNKGIETRQGGN